MILILVLLIIVVIYISSFNNRDRNLDYKLTPEYQKTGNDDKLRTDIIKGLEITIKKEVISNFSDRTLRTIAIENLIETREVAFYMNMESLAQQHKISHNATFDAIFSACNYTRLQFGIPAQTVPVNKSKSSNLEKENIMKPNLSDSLGLTKKQKLCCNIFFGSIISSSYISKPSLWKSYSRVEKIQLGYLGLSMSETLEYLEVVQQSRYLILRETLKTFNDKQIDFLVSMAIELLWCDGIPSKEEFIKFEEVFEKILLIDKDGFSERILKINGLMNKFSAKNDF
jgi:hypothetical protein